MRRGRFVPLAALACLACAALAAPAAAEEKAASATVAHIKLSGSLSETPVAADPLFGVSPENFKSKLDRIKKAKKDGSVRALYLHLDGAEIGLGQLDELTRAIEDFRKSGKKVLAYLEAGAQRDYLLALSCDKVYMCESGWLQLNGIRMEVTFFKDLFEKIGVKADMMQMEAYKGAVEPFTRNKLSPENREQLQSVTDDYYEHAMVGRIVAARKAQKWSPEDVKKLIDRGPFTPKAALKAGLIDGLAYPDGVDDALAALAGAEKVKVAKDYGKAKAEDLDLSNPFAILKLLKPPAPKASKGAKVAVVYGVGPIITGKGGKSFLEGDIIGSTTLVEAIQEAEKDDTVKAIVLRVDSPGGSAFASDLIWNELRRCKKPVVASMGDVAASGGYYISMGASKIYAEPSTLTGSIGVLTGKLTMGGLFDTVGLKTEVIKRGANADMMSTDRPFSPSEREAMRALMLDIYDQFLTKALMGRQKAGKSMTKEQLRKLAGGRIWTGRQAKENGLVDELGTLEDAIADAWKQAKQPATIEPELLILPKPKSPIDALVESLADVKSPALQLRQVPLPREVAGRLKALDGLLRLRGEAAWLVMPYGLKIE